MTPAAAPTDGAQGAPRDSKRWIALAFACLAFALHASHLVYLARSQGCSSLALACPVGDPPWVAGDFSSYHQVANELREAGLFGTSYAHRTPGLPLLMVAAEDATGSANPVRWLGPMAAAVAAAALVSLATRLAGGRLAVGAAAGGLFLLWPAAYRYSAALQTDGLHAFSIVTALALTVAWREDERPVQAGLAALAWSLAQALRPTLFPLAVFLPLLLVRGGASRRYSAVSLALWGSTLLVPALVIGVNHARHGIATSGHVMAVNLGCYAVPRLREDEGAGTFQRLRQQCLLRYRGLPPEERIPAQYAEALPILLERPGATLSSFARELSDQLFHPVVFYDVPRRAALYPRWVDSGRGGMMVWWALAAVGVAVSARERPWLAFFLVVFAGSVILPATTSHLVGGRLRFPLDVVFVPCVALALDAGVRRVLRIRSGAAG